MGTSGAYGGAGTVAWQKVEHLLPNVDLTEEPHEPTIGEAAEDQPSGIEDLLVAVGDALLADDPDLSALRAPTPHSGDGDCGLDTINLVTAAGGRTSGTGRGGGHSARRDVIGGARRAGRALGAAYALQRGDAQQLAAYGFKLADLEGKSRIEQILAIVNAVEGATASGPDDQALRNAEVRQLRLVIVGSPPEPADALRDLLTDYCIDLVYVEIEAIAAKAELTIERLLEVEMQIRTLARSKAARLDVSAASLVKPNQFRDAAEKIVRAVVAVVRTVIA
jgi:hypothetical protein